jgi:hypothetical protein
MRKLSPREAIARSYPSWDLTMADRLITWLDQCGYQIVEKSEANASQASNSEVQIISALEYELTNPAAITTVEKPGIV